MINVFLTIKRSRVPLDLTKFEDVDTDPGLGVFQNVRGSFTLCFLGDGVESKLKKDIKKESPQYRYRVESGHDEDFVLVPTLESIGVGNIVHAFRVQHSDTPTHKLQWYSDDLGRDYPYSYMTLVPIDRITSSNTEITFDYNLK